MLQAAIATATAEAKRLEEEKRAQEEGPFAGMFKTMGAMPRAPGPLAAWRQALGEAGDTPAGSVELSNRQQPGAISFDEMLRTIRCELDLSEDISTSSTLSKACEQLGLPSDGTLEQKAARCYKDIALAGVDVVVSMHHDTEANQWALLNAAERGDTDDVREYLAMGVDVDTRGFPAGPLAGYGATPLLRAAQNGHLGAAEALIAAGADINYESWHERATPLWIAASNGHSEMVRLLRQHGAAETASDAGYHAQGCTGLP